jgi:hypothetical protein
VQNVAQEQLDRDLSDEEIEKICDKIADNIPWYDAIANPIRELIVVDSDGKDTAEK